MYKKIQQKIKRLTLLALVASGCRAPACGCGCVGVLVALLLVPVLLTTLLLPVAYSFSSVRTEPEETPQPSLLKNWQGQSNVGVVDAALEIAPHIHIGGAIHQAQAYDSGLPVTVLHYWQSVCPGCQEWQNGDLQCTFFVMGAYALAGQPLPEMPNAVQYWNDYTGLSGWREIVNGTDPPIPGDIVVWYGGEYGHVAIVTDVTLPNGNKPGSVAIAEANAPEGSTDTLKLVTWKDGLYLQSQPTWGGSWGIIGYIRHTVDVS